MYREKKIQSPIQVTPVEYLFNVAFDRFKCILMLLIWAKFFSVKQSEGREMREFTMWLMRDSDRERVNQGGDRQNCLSFLKWNRLSSLSSPPLTWPQEYSRAVEEGKSECSEVRHTFSSPSFTALCWLTYTNLESSTGRHWFYTVDVTVTFSVFYSTLQSWAKIQ